MNDTPAPHPRVSMALVTDRVEGGVNDTCHTYTGGVKVRQKHIMRNPRVVVILWDHYYSITPDVGTAAVQLITDLVTGPFMNGLVQYGIGRGSSAGQITIDTDQNNPAPASLDVSQVRDQLIQWIRAGTLSPAPSVNETNLLYVIFPSTSTEVKDGDFSTKSPDPKKAICGYHGHGKYNASSQNDDLFWAIMGTDKANQLSGQAFISSLSWCLSHEVAEAFSDRDEQGFIADNGCEIGDICENKTSFQYRGWNVQQYWSNWDSACIHGNQPVSLRKFLDSIKFDNSHGLRSLNTPVINLQYIASRE